MEEKLTESKKANELLQREIDQQREETEKYKSRNSLVELYASNLKKEVDILSFDLNERIEELKKMKGTDWTKQLSEYRNK